jgi:hypothetical protein
MVDHAFFFGNEMANGKFVLFVGTCGRWYRTVENLMVVLSYHALVSDRHGRIRGVLSLSGDLSMG